MEWLDEFSKNFAEALILQLKLGEVLQKMGKTDFKEFQESLKPKGSEESPNSECSLGEMAIENTRINEGVREADMTEARQEAYDTARRHEAEAKKEQHKPILRH